MKRNIRLSIMLTNILIGTFIFNSSFTQGQTLKLHFIVFGDTRDNTSVNNQIAPLINAQNPDLILYSGDILGSTSQTTWMNSFYNSQPHIKTLWDNNKFLAAWGNHESCSTIQNWTPTMTLGGGSCTYSFTQGNIFFICVGEDFSTATTFLTTQLQSAAAQAASWIIIFGHYPVYSSCTTHPASGNATFEGLCDTYNVAFYFSGHSHDYDRSKVMFGQTPVFTGDVIPATQKGTIYTVSGGGGAPIYNVTSKTWQDKGINSYHYMDILSYDDSIRVKVYSNTGTLIDSYVRIRFDPSVDISNVSQQKTELIGAMPNVFSNSTAINYSLDKATNVEIKILDVNGSLIKTLINQIQPAGENSITWDATDMFGNNVSSGIYLCEMVAGQYKLTIKLVLVNN